MSRKIGEIVIDKEYPDGLRFACFNVHDCGSNSTVNAITIEDLNQFANWLQNQIGYEKIARRVIEFNNNHPGQG